MIDPWISDEWALVRPQQEGEPVLSMQLTMRRNKNFAAELAW